MNKIRYNDIQEILKDDLPWNKFDGKTFLVSGANGFIPSYVVDTLIALKNVRVLGIARNEQKAKKKFAHLADNPNFQLIVQDLTVPFDIEEKVDYIIHAASQASPKYYGVDPVGTLKTNTLGTAYLLDIAAKNKVDKFLFFSAGEIYGVIDDSTPDIVEEYEGKLNPTDIRSCYGESKRMGENMCVCYSHQYGFSVNMIRLSHTYGPGVELNDGRVFGDFVNNILNNQNIILNSDGSSKRSFCYITDMVRAMFYVIFYGDNQNAYNISSGKETSILELAKTLINLFPEKHLNVEFKEGVFQQGYLKSKSSRANFNIDKIKKLGWKPQIDIQTGFKRMIESYD